LHQSAALSLQTIVYDSIFLEEVAAPLITKSISFMVLSKLFIPESLALAKVEVREPFG